MTELLPGQAEAIAEVNTLRNRIQRADHDTMALILGQAHTHHDWTDEPVPDALLQQAYDWAKMGPTAMNMQPMRIVFARGAAKERRLVPLMLDSNQAKTLASPVTAILGIDRAFHTKMDQVFPIMPGASAIFSNDENMARDNADRNGTLQAAYFMLALRAVGLDVAPMSGFNAVGVDEEFFAGTEIVTNFIVNIGVGDSAGVFPRLPRLEFEEVAQII